MNSTAQRKEHSKTEFEKKNSENEFGESETFYRSKFSRATGVRVGQRLQSRFGQSSPRIESGTHLSWKCRQLEGVCQALGRLSLFLAGVVASF